MNDRPNTPLLIVLISLLTVGFICLVYFHSDTADIHACTRACGSYGVRAFHADPHPTEAGSFPGCLCR